MPRFSAPLGLVSPTSGSLPRSASRAASCPGPDSRNGLSLSRNGCPFRCLHSGVNVPGLLLQIPPCPSTARSASRSATGLVRPSPRPLHRSWPVAASTLGVTGCASCLHSSSGLLPPSGSTRSTEFAACEPAFRTRPISSRSPPPFLVTSSGVGSSFLVRYVFGGLLFLKPLGTFPTMLPLPVTVK